MFTEQRTFLDTPEAMAFLQRRVALMGKVLAGVFLAIQLLDLVVIAAMDEWARCASVASILGWSCAASMAAVWLACRGGVRSRRFVQTIDAASLMVLAVTLLIMGRHGVMEVYGSVTQSSRHEPSDPTSMAQLVVMIEMYIGAVMAALLALAMAVRAAVVPSSARRTALLTGAMVVPLVVIMGLGALPMAVEREIGARTAGAPRVITAGTLVMLWVPVTIVCTVIGRVVYSLRVQVREAMQLGQYTLQGKLGEGGMGVVYRASHALLRRPTAVKLLHPENLGEESLARFEREVQLTSTLTHPNTITIFDYGRTPEGVLYYAMELLDGAPLQRVVELGGPLPAARVVRVLDMVAASLSEAHGAGLIHRDIKPDNIFLCRLGDELDVAKVLDFGLAKDVAGAEQAGLTHAGTVTGTPLYMAPESLTAPDAVDARSDLYALGAVGYFMLTGQNVFDGRTIMEICGHHLHTVPRSPSERLGRPLHPGLESIVTSCLAKDPARRPASARELRASLAALEGIGAWGQGDARAWWEAHRELLGDRDATAPLELASTVAVDLSPHRRAVRS